MIPKRGRYLALYRDLTSTPAWQSLNCYERAIYVHVAGLFNGANNGRIAVSVKKSAKILHMAPNTAAKVLAALVAKGFLVVTREGAFSLKPGVALATEYRLTEHPCNGEPATREFRDWRPLRLVKTQISMHPSKSYKGRRT
jgi:hypothetical protein